MTEELFDLLRRKGITHPESAQSVLERYRLPQLVDLDRELAETAEAAAEEARETENQDDVTGFDFWPNSDLTAALGGCQEPPCRSQRLERLARFATMWADSIYIPSYFGLVSEEASEPTWRQWLLGSISGLLRVEPGLRAGILRLAPRQFRLCPSCHPQVDAEMRQVTQVLARAERSMQSSYRDRIKVTFEARPGLGYIVAVSGPDDLLSHGWVGFVTDPSIHKPPEWLPRTIRKRAELGERVTYDVPPARLRQSGALKRVIHSIAEDVFNQHLACRLRGTKYLTHRPVDTAFLSAINDNDNFAAWNAVLAQHLRYEMPLLTGVPLPELINLRTHDYEAFQVYRDTMKEIINKHIVNKPAITGTEAKDIYDDIVRPQLHKMNQKLRAAKDKLSNKLRRDVLIAGGVVALGLTTGIVGPGLAALGAAAVTGKNILEQRDASDELKSDNLYFLWKASQKSSRN